MTNHFTTRLSTAVVLAAALTLGACGDERTSGSGANDADIASQSLSGYELTPPPSVAGLSLPDASEGGDFAMEAAPGELNIIYFGYLGCPDVCPTTMAELRKAFRLMPEGQPDKLTVAMGTIDPDRDDPDEVTMYVQSFITNAHGMQTTDQDLLGSVTRAFGASYSTEVDEEGNVEVGHSANLYVVDALGNVVLVWPFGITAQQISDDLQILFARGVA